MSFLCAFKSKNLPVHSYLNYSTDTVELTLFDEEVR